MEFPTSHLKTSHSSTKCAHPYRAAKFIIRDITHARKRYIRRQGQLYRARFHSNRDLSSPRWSSLGPGIQYFNIRSTTIIPLIRIKFKGYNALTIHYSTCQRTIYSMVKKGLTATSPSYSRTKLKWKVKMNPGKAEPIVLRVVTWKQNSKKVYSDWKNVKIIVEGQQLALQDPSRPTFVKHLGFATRIASKAFNAFRPVCRKINGLSLKIQFLSYKQVGTWPTTH